MTQTTINLPTDLYERSRDIAKRLRIDRSMLIREALKARCDAEDAQLRAEEEQQKKEREAKRAQRKRSLGVDDEQLAPSDIDDEPDNDERANEDNTRSLDALYLQHAEKIAESYDDATEKRLAAQVGIKAICALRPLTTDPLVVERRLHKLVEQLLAEKPAEKSKRMTDPVEEIDDGSSIIERILGLAGMSKIAKSDNDHEEENE